MLQHACNSRWYGLVWLRRSGWQNTARLCESLRRYHKQTGSSGVGRYYPLIGLLLEMDRERDEGRGGVWSAEGRILIDCTSWPTLIRCDCSVIIKPPLAWFLNGDMSGRDESGACNTKRTAWTQFQSSNPVFKRFLCVGVRHSWQLWLYESGYIHRFYMYISNVWF